jgi:porphobilinogen synthase
MNGYPDIRLRRLRRTPELRRMLELSPPGIEKLVWPLFVVEGEKRREEITSMPGQYRLGVEALLRELEGPVGGGLASVLLFGVPPEGSPKDGKGSGACRDDGVVQRGVQAIKREFPQLTVFTDVCLCAYTDHGHCGPLRGDGSVDNDGAIGLLAEVALSHAAAGADGVAPSAMMDGQVAAIRAALSKGGFDDTILMSYSTKFASSLYGPFRDAEGSSPQKGDRKGYQASYGDLRQALRESVLDEAEGADILMVKPASLYLDVIARLRERTDLPLAAYNVSGEYSMLIAAAERGWGELGPMVRESLTAIARAGADIIISYWAGRYAELVEGRKR